MKCPIQASAQNIKKSCMTLTNTEPNNCSLCSWSVHIKNYYYVTSAWWKSDCSNCQRLSRFQKMTFNVAENWREEKTSVNNRPRKKCNPGKWKCFCIFTDIEKKHISLNFVQSFFENIFHLRVRERPIVNKWSSWLRFRF